MTSSKIYTTDTYCSNIERAKLYKYLTVALDRKSNEQISVYSK